MIETLWRTTSLFWPARLTPPVSACLIEESNPKRRKATTTDNNVKSVRTFLRFKLLQMRWTNFMSFDGFSAQLAFVEINRARRPGRGVGIMCDHDDRLTVAAVKFL